MDVRLPDGTIVQNVPDGTTQKDLLDTLAQNGYDVSEIQRKSMFPIGKAGLQQAAQEIGAQQTLGGKIGLGIGAGAERVARGLGIDWLAQRMGAQPGAGEVMPAAEAGAGAVAKGADIAASIPMFVAVPATGVRSAATSLGLKAPWLATRLGTVGDVGLTSGALTGATTPGDLAERVKQALFSTGLSMALPGSMAAVQGARRMATRKGVGLGQVEKAILQETGGNAEALASRLRQPYPNAPLGVNPSAAMASQNPTLQALELGSRVKRPDLWAGRDEANALARWTTMQKVAGDDQALAGLTSARNAASQSLREQALSAAGNQQGFEIPVARKAAEILTGEARPIPQATQMANYVWKELEQGTTPAQLYSIRKTLTSDIPVGTELGASIKFARKQRMELVGAIDQSLDAASGGLWSGYLGAYKAASPMITSMKSAQKIEDVFARSTPAGQVPQGMKAGATTMARAINKFGSKEFGGKVLDRLTPGDRQTLEMIADDLARQQAVMRSGAVVGSDTAAKLAAGGRADAITQGLVDSAFSKAVPFGRLVAPDVRGILARRREEILGELLADPQKLANAIDAVHRGQALMSAAAQSGKLTRGGIPQDIAMMAGQ